MSRCTGWTAATCLTRVSSCSSRRTIVRLSGAYNVICAFNVRRQELDAHPGFSPTLLSHEDYLAAYASWDLVKESDSDLTETHPHNNLEHTHSMTRILARKTHI